MSRTTWLNVDDVAGAALVAAARDRSPVKGLTHNFYRYPARFSPRFVRTSIETFSKPGDLVLDPFMGGGTSLVEALALGRCALGVDISSLAAFISEVKTTLYSERDLKTLFDWAAIVPAQIGMHRSVSTGAVLPSSRYQRHLKYRTTWRLRKSIEQALATTEDLKGPALQAFARCAILRTAQWALDGRRNLPSVDQFRAAFSAHTTDMIAGARELRVSAECHRNTRQRIIRCLNRSTIGVESEPKVQIMPRARVVITSPPYPGVHVLYHRWQVDGRKETPAPFWIAGRSDGSGSAYYTMGDRHAHELRTYFDGLRDALRSVAALCGRDTMLVQVMAFSEPSWQLPRYLSAADDAGFTEQFLFCLRGEGDGRLWRGVPNRKWHAQWQGITYGSQEVVLFHRLGT